MRVQTNIQIIVKEGYIFKSGKLKGANIKVDKWKVENDIISFEKFFNKIEVDPVTKKEKRTPAREKAEFLIEEELILLNVDGVRVFPIFEQQEEEDDYL